MWGNLGVEGIPLVFSDSVFTLQFVDYSFPLYVILDPTMTIYYHATNVSNATINYRIDQLLENLPPLTGDLNYDLTLDVIDIVLLIDLVIIFSQNGEITDQELQIADIYNDGQLNIIDIVGLVNIILDQ